MDPYQETHKTWNKVAKRYQEAFMNLDIYNTTYDRFCQLIAVSNASILEIGCGPGNITKYITQQIPDATILATDVAPNMIALAQKNVPTASYKLLDARTIDIKEKCFDGVISGFIIPYLSKTDTIKFIKNIANCLHKEGIFYLSFVAGNYTDSGYITGSTGDRTYFYYHQIPDIKDLLFSQGFSIEIQFEIPYDRANNTSEIHTILLAKKL